MTLSPEENQSACTLATDVYTEFHDRLLQTHITVMPQSRGRSLIHDADYYLYQRVLLPMIWITDFETRGFASVRQQVVSTLPYSDGFILIEGKNGCGKSSLKHSLEADLADSCTVINLPYSRLNTDQLLSSLIAHSETPSVGMTDELTLQHLATTCQARSRPLRLLIDDVQFMPSNALLTLLQLGDTDQAAPCAIGGVCFAPEGFGEAFSLACVSQGQADFSLNLRIAPPTDTEQRLFIRQLLVQTPTIKLTDDALQYLIQCADGCLQRLKQLTGAIGLELTLSTTATVATPLVATPTLASTTLTTTTTATATLAAATLAAATTATATTATATSAATQYVNQPQLRDLLNRSGLIQEDAVLLNAIAPSASPDPEQLTARADPFVFLDDEKTTDQPDAATARLQNETLPNDTLPNELSVLPEPLELITLIDPVEPEKSVDPMASTIPTTKNHARVQSELSTLATLADPLTYLDHSEETAPTKHGESPTGPEQREPADRSTIAPPLEPPELTQRADSAALNTPSATRSAAPRKPKHSAVRLIALLLIGVAATLGAATISGYTPYSWDALRQLAQPSTWQQQFLSTSIPSWYAESSAQLQRWMLQFSNSDGTSFDLDAALLDRSQATATSPVIDNASDATQETAQPTLSPPALTSARMAETIPAEIKAPHNASGNAPTGSLSATAVQTETVASRAATINNLLTLARTDEQYYRFTYPLDNNAVTRYRQVLQLDPTNSQARAGINRIQLRYQKRAQKALEQQRWAVARVNYHRLLWIDNKHSWARDGLAQLPSE